MFGDIKTRKYDILSIIIWILKKNQMALLVMKFNKGKRQKMIGEKLLWRSRYLGDKNLELYGLGQVIRILSSPTGRPIFTGSSIICLLRWWMGFAMKFFRI